MTVEELEIVIKAKVGDALNGIRQVVEAVKNAAEKSIAPMQQIASQSKQIGTQTAISMQSAKSSIKSLGNEIKATTAQQQVLLNKINDLKASLEIAGRDPKLFSKSEVLEMRAEVEKLTNQYNKLGSTGNKANNEIANSIKKGVSSLRRFALSLFSIRGIYSAISRVVAQYKQADESLRASQELTINAMGQVLAPVIKIVTNLIQYLVIGISTLVKMFTGFDAVAKTTTKSISKTTKETKKLNKELTSMDEITNLSDKGDTAAMQTLAADLKALDDFNEKVKEVQKLFESWGIQKIVDKLKELWNWIVENKTAIIILGTTLGTIFAVAKISLWLNGISLLIGSAGIGAAVGTGLAGLLAVLLAIAAIKTIVTTIKTIYEEIKSGQAASSQTVDTSKSVAESGVKAAEIIKEKDEKTKEIALESWYKQLSQAEAKVKQFQKEYDGLNILQRVVKGKIVKDNIKAWQTQVDAILEQIKIVRGDVGFGRFATGGVVNEPTYGLIGEYSGAKSNPEIISPQNIMRETLQQALEPYMLSLANNNQEKGDIILNVNGRELAKATYNDYNFEGGRLGRENTMVRRVG